MSGSFNTKNGVLYTGDVVGEGGYELETDPVYAQNMLYINASLEVTIDPTLGQQLSGNIYLQASNQEGNETPGIGTTSVTKWVTVNTASISYSTGTAVMPTLSVTDFAYKWFRFKYAPDAGATPGLIGTVRYTMKGW